MADSLQIFTVTKDPELARKFEFADNVYRFLKATELVFIVPKNLTRDFLIAYGSRDFCKIVEEGEILKQSLSDIEKWEVWGFPARAGWYFQQFLKLAIAQTSIAQERYVIWDADTIPYRHMSFFDDKMRMLFTTGPEFHEPYFRTNNMLIGVNRCLHNLQFSAISQHMPVYRDVMLDLLDRIGQRKNGDWVSAIRAVISDGRPDLSLFSEYEIFADWVRVTRPNQFALRRLPWNRNGNRCTPFQLTIAKQVMYFIAYESGQNATLSWRELRREIIRAVLPDAAVSRIRRGLQTLRGLR
jgi:hypothetical protein